MHAIYLLCLQCCIAGKWGPFTRANTLPHQNVYQSQSLGIFDIDNLAVRTGFIIFSYNSAPAMHDKINA